MTIDSLLHRASELAPEWCEISPNAIYVGTSPDWFMLNLTPTDDNRARILYAVLQECERRGIHIAVERTVESEQKWIARLTVWGNGGEWTWYMADDPAEAALSAFVSYLEATTPVTNEGVTNAGE